MFSARHLRGNSKHRHPAAMAIVQAVDEVHVAGPAAARTHDKRTGQVRLRPGSEGRDFLVADRHPLDGLLRAQRLGQPVEGVADDAVDAFDARGGKSSDDQFSDVCLHKTKITNMVAWESMKLSSEPRRPTSELLGLLAAKLRHLGRHTRSEVQRIYRNRCKMAIVQNAAILHGTFGLSLQAVGRGPSGSS